MKHLLMLALLVAVFAVALAKPASAQTVPNVSGLTPFSASTNFMSLPGFLRWQYHEENGAWISWTEAAALVRSQTTVAAAP